MEIISKSELLDRMMSETMHSLPDDMELDDEAYSEVICFTLDMLRYDYGVYVSNTHDLRWPEYEEWLQECKIRNFI